MSPLSLRSFAASASRARRETWPTWIRHGTDATRILAAKSPTQILRVPQEQGAGWVQRAVCTFQFPASATSRPDVGSEFAVITCNTEEEVGTRWRCFDFIRGSEDAGSDHRCVCYRLDD